MTSNINSVSIEQLSVFVEDVLRQNAFGISEYDLLQLVRKRFAWFQSRDDKTVFALFKQHFLLFHVLYRLRVKLVSSERITLEINPIQIKLLPMTNNASGQIDVVDALAHFYADFTHFEKITAADLDEWLCNFRIRMRTNISREAALRTLELNNDVSDREIVESYRRLAGRFHPDRHGDSDKIKEINAAYRTLKQKKSRR